MNRHNVSWRSPLLVGGVALLAATPFVAAPAAGISLLGDLRAVTYANTALAGSTLLYLVYLWYRSEAVGRAASALAAGGAAGVLAAVAFGFLGDDGPGPGLFEVTALLTASTVFAYLALERVYRSRIAGVAVMPAVMVAVLCEMWLISRGYSRAGALTVDLGGYWEAGYRFAICLGYCPLVAAGLLAAGHGSATPCRWSGWRAAMGAALGMGAPLLALGAAMAVAGSVLVHAGPSVRAGEAVTAWMAAAAAAAGWVQAGRSDDARLARVGAMAFLVVTASLLLADLLTAA